MLFLLNCSQMGSISSKYWMNYITEFVLYIYAKQDALHSTLYKPIAHIHSMWQKPLFRYNRPQLTQSGDTSPLPCIHAHGIHKMTLLFYHHYPFRQFSCSDTCLAWALQIAQTPLHVAAAHNKKEIVKFLLNWQGPEKLELEAKNMVNWKAANSAFNISLRALNLFYSFFFRV